METYSNEIVPARGAGAGDLNAINTIAVTSPGGVGAGVDTELGDEVGVDAALLNGEGGDADRNKDGGNESGRELHFAGSKD